MFYRVIRYWSPYSSGGEKFSDCSTKFYTIGGVFYDIPTNEELNEFSISDDVENGYGDLVQLSDVVDISEKHFDTLTIVKYAKALNKTITCYMEEVPYFYGVILVKEEEIQPLETGGNLMSQDTFDTLVNCGGFSINTFGVDTYGAHVLVVDSWQHFPMWKLFGYDEDESIEALNISEIVFSDDHYQCSQCGVIDSSEHMHMAKYEFLGKRCGCWDVYCAENYTEFLNDHSKAISELAIKSLKRKVALIGEFASGWYGINHESKDIYTRTEELFEKNKLAFTENEGFLSVINYVHPFETGFNVYAVMKDSKRARRVEKILSKDVRYEQV